MVFITNEEILETVRMIQDENLDVRAVTMGISLGDCASRDVDRVCERVHDKLVARAGRLVPVALEIQEKYGVPIVNRRVSVTPIAGVLAAAAATPSSSSPMPWTRPPPRSASTSWAASRHSSRRASHGATPP